MTAALTDKWKKVGASTVTSLAAPGKALGATSITVGSTTNHAIDTGTTIAIRVVDTAGKLIPGTYTEWNAIVTSATSFTLDPTPVYGSDQVYAAGSSTQVYVPISSSAHNQLVDGLLVSHDQDGTLKAGAVDVAAVLANDVVETAKIKDLNVTSAKLADGAVTPAKMSGIDLFGVAGALNGTAPAALTGQFYIQSGSTVVTVDGNGNGLITFPTAFPSGVLSVICVNGDVSTIAAGAAVGVTNSVTAANFYAHANVASVGIRFNWIAIGF